MFYKMIIILQKFKKSCDMVMLDHAEQDTVFMCNCSFLPSASDVSFKLSGYVKQTVVWQSSNTSFLG
jgi:hypothetical protein